MLPEYRDYYWDQFLLFLLITRSSKPVLQWMLNPGASNPAKLP